MDLTALTAKPVEPELSDERNRGQWMRRWGKRCGEGSDRPDVGGDEDDDGEGAEPCVSDGGDDVARHGGAGEVAERDDDHAQRQGQRYQVEHPHRAARAPSAPPRRQPEEGEEEKTVAVDQKLLRIEARGW